MAGSFPWTSPPLSNRSTPERSVSSPATVVRPADRQISPISLFASPSQTAREHEGRIESGTTLFSAVSRQALPVPIDDENRSPPRTLSLGALELCKTSANIPRQTSPRSIYERTTSLESDFLNAWSLDGQIKRGRDDEPLDEEFSMEDIDLTAGCGAAGSSIDRVFDDFACMDAQPHAISVYDPPENIADAIPRPRDWLFREEEHPHLFHKWMRTLRRRKTPSPMPLRQRQERWSLDDPGERVGRHESFNRAGHRKSTSHSSSAFVTAVKSATASLASMSLAPRSRHLTRSNRSRAINRSSKVSSQDVRMSTDSRRASFVIDEAAWARSLKRRQVLEEILTSEESYVADLKVFINVSEMGKVPSAALSANQA